MKKKDFIELAGISFSTMSELNHGENVTTEVLVKICRAPDYTLDDIMEIIPDADKDSKIE